SSSSGPPERSGSPTFEEWDSLLISAPQKRRTIGRSGSRGRTQPVCRIRSRGSVADKKKRPGSGKGVAKEQSSNQTAVAPVESTKTTALQKVESPAPVPVPEGKTADEKEEPSFLVVG